PLDQKIDARLVVHANVSPQIQKLMLRQRRGEERRDSPAAREAQALLRERDETAVRIAIAQIQIERNDRRQQSRLDAEMHEERVTPVGDKECCSHRSSLRCSSKEIIDL